MTASAARLVPVLLPTPEAPGPTTPKPEVQGFGALLRLFYFYIVVMLLLIGFAWALGWVGIVVPDYHARLTNYLLGLARDHPREVLAFVAGFVTGGAAHTIADWLVTGGKRYLHRLGFRVSRDYSGHDHHHERYHGRHMRSW